MSRGAGFEGGHLEGKGLSPAGQVVSVPKHRHDVELDFVRYEFAAEYAFSEAWSARLRVPYDVKERTARVETIDPATPAQVAAMQRNLDSHHPTETLEGFGDFSLLGVRRARGVFRDGDALTASFGTSLPVGRTEDDPYVLGDAGLPHEHVQFGSGTFDPLLELEYAVPLSERLRLGAHALSRLPLYENDEGYEAPIEVSSGLGVALAATERLSLRLGWSFYYQHYAHWDGARDPNSGLESHGVVAGASWRVADAVRLGVVARFPVSQETLADDGDTFEQGTVVQLGLTYSP